MSDLAAILPAALLVGVLALDHTAVGQFMVSQPLVGGWLMGIAFGRPLQGLAAGALLQLLCLTELPVGASIPLDGELAGLTGTALFLTLPRPGHWTEASVLGLAVLLFFPLAWAGRSAEVAVRRWNGLWTGVARSRLREGRHGTAQLAALGGIALFFAKAFLLALLPLWLCRLAVSGPGAGGSVLPGLLEVVARVAPFAALGAAAATLGGRRSGAAVALGFAAGLLVSWRAL